MDLRQLTPDLAVSPQIETDDLIVLAEAGFRTIINNRPDDETARGQDSESMRRAAEDLGLRYYYLPFVPGAISPELIEGYREALADESPAFAYCRSGNRSTVLWALTQAGTLPTAEILSTAAAAGYDLSGVRPMIEALATR